MKKKKGFMVATMVTMMLVVIVLGISVMIMRNAGLKNLKAVGQFIPMQDKECEKALSDWGIDPDILVVTGEKFARTVAKCGFCIGKYEGPKGKEDAYFLHDFDGDGVPDRCDANPNSAPEKGKPFITHCESGEYMISARGAFSMRRCCMKIGDIPERYCK